MSKRTLITGGAGFIGTHLCEALLKQGHEVLCVDNYFTGKRSNIAHLLDNPSFEAMRHDICEPLNVEVDEIYNLACPASPIHYQLDPVQTTRTNVLGALNMLELATRLGIPVLQASTSEVYGDPSQHPQTESYVGSVNIAGPRACYDEGKRCAETLFYDYRRQHQLPIRIARIFNTYGPRMLPDDGRVVSNFIVQALANKPITVYGSGEQTRSFCFVSDLVSALIVLMAQTDPKQSAINLGNPSEMTVAELAHLIVEMTGSKSEIEFKQLPTDDPVRRCPDISLAKKILNWQPEVLLKDGLTKTIASFTDQK